MHCARCEGPALGSERLLSLLVLLAVVGSTYLVWSHLSTTLLTNLSSFAKLAPLELSVGAVLLRALDHVHALLSAGLVAVAAMLVGDLVLPPSPTRPWQVRLVVATMLGYAALALVFFALALVHLLYAPLLQLMLVLAPLVRWRRLWTLLGRLRSALAVRHADPVQAVLAGVVVLLVGCSLLYALAPPVTYDALQYHLATPQAYLHAHSLVDVPHNVTSHYSPFFGIVFFLGSLFGSDAAPQVLSWSTGVLAALLVYGFAARYGLGGRAGLMAVVVLVSVPYLFVITSQLWVDLAVAAAVCSALVLLLEWRSSLQARLLALAGGLTGLALAGKYSAVVDLVALEAVLVWLLVTERRLGWRQRLMQLVVFNLVALAVFAPHLGWTFARTGNPVFPMLDQMMPQPEWHNAEATSLMFATNRRPALGNPLSAFYDLLYMRHFENSTVGPLPQIGLLVVVLMARRRVADGARLVLLFLLLDAGVFWLTRGISLRYASSITVTLAVLSGWVWQPVLSRRGLPRAATVLVGAVVVWLLGYQLMLGNVRTNALRYSLGLADRQQYLAEEMMTSYTDAAAFLNSSRSSGRVLLLGESRTYYLERRSIADAPYGERSLIGDLARGASSGDELGRRLRAMEVTELLINVAEIRRTENVFFDWDHATLQRFLAFLWVHTDVVYEDDHATVRRLVRDAPDGHRPPGPFDEELYYLSHDIAESVIAGLRRASSFAEQRRYRLVLQEYQWLLELAPYTRQLYLGAAAAAEGCGEARLASRYRRQAAALVDPDSPVAAGV